jgi:hypothetical protein
VALVTAVSHAVPYFPITSLGISFISD